MALTGKDYNKLKFNTTNRTQTETTEAKKDCFAYRKRGNSEMCIALSGLYCKGGKCNFYRTKKDMCESCKKAIGRVTSCKECEKLLGK